MSKRFEEVSLARLHAYSYIVMGHLALFYLIYCQEWKLLIVSYIMQFLIVHLGISMTYHRAVSHNSVTLPKWLEFIGLVFGGLSFQGSAISWCATHRQHHLKQGTIDDPHSPKHLGSWYVHTFAYAFSKVDFRSVVRLLRTHHYSWHRYYYYIFPPILLLSVLLLPLNIALCLFFAPIALTFLTVNFINTWTHDWDNDVPVNRPIVWLFLGGEAWHEVHHSRPIQLRLHKYDFVGYFLEKLNQK